MSGVRLNTLPSSDTQQSSGVECCETCARAWLAKVRVEKERCLLKVGGIWETGVVSD
jgi:hypothetical protein